MATAYLEGIYRRSDAWKQTTPIGHYTYGSFISMIHSTVAILTWYQT